MEELEDEADRAGAGGRRVRRAGGVDVLAGDEGAGRDRRWGGASAESEEEGGLAGARRALDGDELAAVDGEVDGVEATERGVGTGEFAGQLLAADHGWGGLRD